MKVVATVGEISNSCDWEAFCDMTGVGHYAMAEGMDPDTEFTFTPQQAETIGLIKRRRSDYGDD